MENISIDKLDDDCWQLIFEKLRDNNYDFASVSIACKRFHLITNRAKISLFVSKLTLHLLPNFLRNFRNLKSLEFCINKSHTDPNCLITQIWRSDLQHLEALKFHGVSFSKEYLGVGFCKLDIKMKGLKSLDLCGLYYLCDDDLMVLKDLFPCLEELVISISWRYGLTVTDDGIEALASKLYGLRRITLGSCPKITDKSLMSLSSNCVDLMDVDIQNCPCVTENGVGFLMRYSPKLTSLCLSFLNSFWQKESEFTFENSISYANNLEHLDLFYMKVPDGVPYAIAKASPPLKRFCFVQHGIGQNFMHGLTLLASVCPFLKKISAQIDCLTEKFVLDISKDLGSLTHIDLTVCFKLGSASFFTLTKNCPLLESIVMRSTNVGACEDVDDDLHQNYAVKRLDLSGCSSINDRALVRFSLVCPNLEFLILDGCRKITNTGVAECLRVCPKLKHLDISVLGVSNFMGQSMDSKLKLNSISARNTNINDEALRVIGERCPDLEKLNIRDCRYVTDHGVKELMSKCKKLRHLNLIACMNVNIDLLDWIINLRPSLKSIHPPCDFDPTEEQRHFFLRKGCMILAGYHSGSDDE